MAQRELPLPPHFVPDKVGTVWKVLYQERAREAEQWAEQHSILPAATDRFKICLVAVDVQNTFCIPGFELFVAGRSGSGAVDDNRRLCAFIYRNLDVITRISPTMDTHQAVQIFHSVFWINDKGEHPGPYTLISEQDVTSGRWRFNPALSYSLGIDEHYAQRHLRHYTRRLKEGGKYQLTIWPYHVMLGSIGHALVSAVEEAIFFHSIARYCQPNFQLKGNNPFTEHYSVLGPEVLDGPDGAPLAQRNRSFIEQLVQFDAVIIAGQAKSHCVAWTVEDLLKEISVRDTKLAAKVYLLEDCTSPVVVPGVMDYTDEADAAFRRFADAGMHIVRSTDPIESWPGIKR
ncbi:MAG: isochorismatase [Methanophagales archaeon ANME-1-THS]|nr:MAG: isochorismatase [Methanophagales archaeon ANME-1-THS]